jgi:putative restriction endonuclease
VDAAHIHPFSDSRNNDVRNGLALTKNMHWAFDEGLWSVADGWRVIVAGQRFEESCPDGMALMGYAGAQLRLPRDRDAWPDPRYFDWHREHRFCGST